MGSLFTKIFLSFWLAALLLGGAMFAAERYLGEDYLAQVGERVEAHAETVSTLLSDQGLPAVNRWLAGMRRSEHMLLVLLDRQGHPVPDPRLPRRLRDRLSDAQLTPGIHHLHEDIFAVVRPVPGSNPPLYLAAVTRLEHAHYLPLAARLAIAVVISGLVVLGLATLMTRPIRRLRAAAQALAEGDLSVRVGYRGRDEVAALARDFDIMAARIRDLLEAQRRLLRDVSHELRSPLARLRVALELARRKGDTATALERIEREADRLEVLVGDVLSLARLESTQTTLARKPVDLAALLEGIVHDADFEAQARERRVQFAAEAPATVLGDAVLLRAAVENVVRNAVRHTAPETTVEVALRHENRRAVVEVRDHGDGVPESELDRLFEPFTRVGEGRDRASGGYGLGLAISRRAAEAHGGDIHAANAVDGGLRVTLSLPLAD
jgi:signal transduction histidine kinase